jgi:hypothetical protein
VGTVNVGSRAPACPPFIVVLRERGSTAIQDKRPDQDANQIGFQSGDPEITFLTLYSMYNIPVTRSFNTSYLMY